MSPYLLEQDKEEGAPPLVNRESGPTQTTPKIFLIFWGSNWNTSDTGVKKALEGFYQGVTGTGTFSEWSGILKQYCGPTGCPVPNGATIGGVWIDPEHLHPSSVCDEGPNPFTCTGQSVYGEVNRAVYLPGSAWSAEANNPNAQFIVIPAKYTTYVNGWFPAEKRKQFCGYHGRFENATYTFLPDIADESATNPFGGTTCLYSGDGTTTNAETGVAAHEFAESVTDPKINAWRASGSPYGEIGDLCEMGHDQYHSSGTWVQGLWDDHLNACALYDSNPPVVVPTDPPDGASGETETTATLNANINPNGTETHVFFEWGPTSSYGNITPALPGTDVGSGTTSQLVSAGVSGLRPGVTYHFRSVVYNAWSGYLYGPDQTFTTKGAGSSRSALIDPSGHRYVYYLGANGQSYEDNYGSGGWSNVALPESERGSTTQPTAVMDSNGYRYVFYTGTNRQVWENYWTGNTWTNEQVKTNEQIFNNTVAERTAANSSPSAVVNSADHQYVYYAGANGQVWEDSFGWGEGGWANTQITNGQPVAANTSPAPLVDASGNRYIYYAGANGQVWEDYWNGSAWSNAQITNGQPVAANTSPTALIDASGHRYVYYVGANGQVWEDYWNGSAWSNAQIANGQPVAANATPTALLSSGNRYIYYVGANGQVWEDYWNGSAWGNAQIANGEAAAAEFSPSALSDPGGHRYVYYVGANGQIWEDYWNGSAWGNAQIASGQPVASPPEVTEEGYGSPSLTPLLSGRINPEGGRTRYQFEYGRTTSYGHTSPASPVEIGSGSEIQQVNQLTSVLEPETEYHYRLTATNFRGTTHGSDKTLVTPSVMSAALSSMHITDPLESNNGGSSSFSSNWSALGWAGGSSPKGKVTEAGWGPASTYPTVNGASYASPISDTGSGIANMIDLAETPGLEGRSFSLWLDMATPSATKAGYQLTFTDTATNTYEVTLSKWVGGAQTVLATKAGYNLPKESWIALVDQGGTVSAWTDPVTGRFSEVLHASDSTFEGGYAGIEGAGNITRLSNFKLGALLLPATNMDTALQALTTDDPFSAIENPLSYNNAFAPLHWDTSTTGHNTGQVATAGWGPYDPYPAVNGAFWQKAQFADTGTGDAASTTLNTQPGVTSRYFSLWLNMSTPATGRSGYELRFTETSLGIYEVTLSKWQSEAKTILASKTGYSFPIQSQFALVDKGGTVSAWTKTGAEFTQLLSAGDSTFLSGYAGIEASGNNTRLGPFRAGPLLPF
ncbi:MAG: hypothetical protein ACTHO8_05175 [Solirubrobacterales bacterium]